MNLNEIKDACSAKRKQAQTECIADIHKELKKRRLDQLVMLNGKIGKVDVIAPYWSYNPELVFYPLTKKGVLSKKYDSVVYSFDALMPAGDFEGESNGF